MAAKPGDNCREDTPPGRTTGTRQRSGQTPGGPRRPAPPSAAPHPRPPPRTSPARSGRAHIRPPPPCARTGTRPARPPPHLAVPHRARTRGVPVPVRVPVAVRGRAGEGAELAARAGPGCLPLRVSGARHAGGPKIVVTERGPASGRPTCAARGQPQSLRPSAALPPRASAQRAGWHCVRGWLPGGGLGAQAGPLPNQAVLRHGPRATSCADCPHVPPPPSGTPNPALPGPAFQADHMPWARRLPGKTAVAQTCPGGTALPAPSHSPAPGAAFVGSD